MKSQYETPEIRILRFDISEDITVVESGEYNGMIPNETTDSGNYNDIFH